MLHGSCKENSQRIRLLLIVDRNTIKRHKLDKCVPLPKPRTTLNSFTNPSKQARETNCDSLVHPKQVRIMLSLAVSEGVRVVIKNHYYTFGCHIHKQGDGGGIGTEIAGEVTRNTMGHWNVKFL